MAKAKVIEVDFDDYEERDSTGYNGDEPKRGIYDGKLVSFKEHTSSAGNEGLEFIFEITSGEYAGWRGWVYGNMESAKWKVQQIATAINSGSKKKVKLLPAGEDEDGRESKTVKKASPVRLVIRTEKYEGEARGRIRTILPMESDSDDDDDSGDGEGPSF